MKKVVVFLCLSLVIDLFFRQSVQAQSGNSNPVSVIKPEFPGGMDSLYNFIYKRLDKYTFSKAELEATHDRVLFLLFSNRFRRPVKELTKGIKRSKINVKISSR